MAERLLARLRPGAALVTVCEFHPASLFWLGAVAGNVIVPLGVDRFGEGFRMPARRSYRRRAVRAGVRKPPRKEPAGRRVGRLTIMGI